MQIQILDARTLTAADARAIGELLAAVWSNPEKPVAFRTRQLLDMGQGYHGTDRQAPRSFVIREAGRVIAHAAIIPRTIGTAAGELTIAGLARVCTDPDQRGRALGRLITEAAFGVVDTGAFGNSLFQTTRAVRPFYEKLGCCLVDNPIVNSLGEDPRASPFWGDAVMRYPTGDDWPHGEIDLRGPGY
jgi:predicted N-acetyltransferase YhbS